jgi:ribonuclease III
MVEIADSKYPDIVMEERLESKMGYTFRDPALRTRAITRRAFVNDMGPAAANGGILDNEALATLGDAVIDVVVLTYLSKRFTKKGDLSKEKDNYVNHKKLTETAVAEEVRLLDCMLLGKCETWDAGKGPGEILESVIGAIFLDCYKCGEDGIKACEAVMRKINFPFELHSVKLIPPSHAMED